MVLLATKRFVDSTVIIELKGRITLGEGSVVLEDIVKDTVSMDKPERFVLDISGVEYIDSSGIGALVSAFTKIKNTLGCNLVLCHPRYKALAVLMMTKLATVFNITTTVEQALSGVRSEQLRFSCPVTSCLTWSLLQPGSDYQSCARCNSQYKLTFNDTGELSGRIDHVLMSSYPGEVVSFTPGRVPIITTSGPVDLFVSNILERAWLCMSWEERAAVFDLRPAAEITEPAIRRLLEIGTHSKRSGRGLIVLPSSHPFSSLEHPAVYTEMKSARDRFREDPAFGISTHFMY
jgi:anti-sigma B factor antagonist